MEMTDFFLGIIASILATLFISLVKGQSIRYFRFNFLRRLTNDEIAYRAKSLSKVIHLVKKSIANSQELRVYSNRGHFLTDDRGILNYVLKENNLQSIRCLFSNQSNFLTERAKEFCNINSGYNQERYIQDVARSIQLVEELAKKDERIQTKKHIQPVTFRFILTNSHLFITYFEKNKAAKDTEVLVYPNHTLTYHGFDRFFETIWRES